MSTEKKYIKNFTKLFCKYSLNKNAKLIYWKNNTDTEQIVDSNCLRMKIKAF